MGIQNQQTYIEEAKTTNNQNSQDKIIEDLNLEIT